MKRVCAGVVFALAAVSFTGAGQFGSAVVHAAQNAQATTTMKGVIKKIDDSAIVIVPSTNKKAEVTFDLSSSVKREGELAAGDTATITYYYDSGKRVVTTVAGKPASSGKVSK